MQINVPDGIVIACDFCGRQWDEHYPMIEGHRGSIICLDCLKVALDAAQPAETPFFCTMAQREYPAGTKVWFPPQAAPGVENNPEAAIGWECIRMAAKGFHKDPDTDFRWDPARYPA